MNGKREKKVIKKRRKKPLKKSTNLYRAALAPFRLSFQENGA